MTARFLAFDSDTDDLATYTFADQPLGHEAEDRTIIVMGACRGTGGCTSLTVTVAGVTAVVDVATLYTGTGTCTFAARAEVPTGTTGDVVVTASATQLRCHVGVYSMNGRVSLVDWATDDAPDSEDLRVQSCGVTVVAGGEVFALGAVAAAAPGGWTSGADRDGVAEPGVAEDYDEQYDTSMRVVGLHVPADTNGSIWPWVYVEPGFTNRFLTAVSYRSAPWWTGLPWESAVVTVGWEAAVTADVRDIAYRVPVLDPAGVEVGDVPATGLTVDFDGEAMERWELELTLSDPAWVPTRDSDALDGRSGLRARPYWQLLNPDGSLMIEIPLCTVWLEDPDIDDDGTSVSVSVRGFDAVNRARRGGYGGATIDVSGMTVSAALAVTLEALAVTDYRIAAATATVPDPYVLGGKDDPWDDVVDLAEMAGCDVWADRMGAIIVAPRPDPQSVRLDWQEGPDCPVVALKRSPRTSSIRNRVVCSSSSPDVTPVSVVVEDTDPGSPTWVGGPFGVRETPIQSDKIADEEGARNMAAASYARWIRGTDSLTVEARQRPDLMFRDLIAAKSDRAGVTGLWRVRGWTLRGHAPGGVPATMTVRMQTRSLV